MPRTTTSKKRHGKHHRHGRDYLKVYTPYLPLFISLIASVFLSFSRPSHGNTLAYATEMSISGLLSATNSNRASNGVAALSLNGPLNNAAQAKANDMIARNYWSHTTPDGQQPWVFIDNAGYKYLKAGENLAYGFATSSDTVTGWMNSPTHKENMLDTAFSEVGFGFANGSNYNGAGQETVVVAMYGKPQTLGATTQQAAPPAPSTSVAQAPTPAPEPAPTPTPTPAPAPEPETKPAPVTTDQPVAASAPLAQEIPRSQTVLGGRVPWLLGTITVALGVLLAFKLLHLGLQFHRFLRHHPKLRHALRNGQTLVLHHPLLDSTIVGLAILSFVLSRTVGIIL